MSARKPPMLVFDLDGVLLSERPYWETAAAATVSMAGDLQLELPELSVESVRGTIPCALIDSLKERGVNSNWELTDVTVMAAIRLGFEAQPYAIQRAIASIPPNLVSGWAAWSGNWQPARLDGNAILRLFDDFRSITGETTGHAAMGKWRDFLAAECPELRLLWQSPGLQQLVRLRFQEIHAAAAPPAASPVDIAALRQKFERIKNATPGCRLGIATGRPESEALGALRQLGLADYFPARNIATYDQVAEAETVSGRAPLSKPHPYSLLKAACPDKDILSLCDPGFARQARADLVYIGDSGSDILAAQAAGARAWMVLSGCAGEDARPRRQQQFAAMKAERIYPDILELMDNLEDLTP